MATLAQVKRDFEFGLITSASVHRVLDFLVVEFSYRGGFTTKQSLDDARTKTPRHFKSFDAAIRAVESVGFPVDYLVIGGQG